MAYISYNPFDIKSKKTRKIIKWENNPMVKKKPDLINTKITSDKKRTIPIPQKESENNPDSFDKITTSSQKKRISELKKQMSKMNEIIKRNYKSNPDLFDKITTSSQKRRFAKNKTRMFKHRIRQISNLYKKSRPKSKSKSY